MADVMDKLFDMSAMDSNGKPSSFGPGILPYQAIRALVRDNEVFCRSGDIETEQFQPASIDLRLGPVAYRVRASFLPGPNTKVLDKLKQLNAHSIDLSGGAVLERGCVYIVPLMEELSLSPRISAFANPKSSTGRLDVFTRLIADSGTAFDLVPEGYSGALYAEIAPRTFSIFARQRSRLSQLRFRRGTAATVSPRKQELKRLQAEFGFVSRDEGSEDIIRDKELGVTVDLVGPPGSVIVGWRAKRHSDLIDVDKKFHYDPYQYWDPIERRQDGTLVLDPTDFYILATRESIVVPPEFAAEMVAYDPISGEFRVHYAGFFDPGFGHDADVRSSRAVLEVRCHDVPFILEHGQTVGWLRYEKLTHATDRPYGGKLGSHYQGQGLTLARQFKAPAR